MARYENGALLAKAGGAHFDVVITKDSGIEYEQGLKNLPVAVIILKAKSNALDDIRPLVPALLDALSSLAPKTLVRVT